MKVLGIETSCDETAAAVVADGRTILSSVVASQEHVHVRFGGIVPELASRNHVAAILPVIEGAFEKSALTLADIDGIAVTRGPGLIGSLLVGLSTAKAIAYARGIPFVGIHHIEGHLAAALLDASVSDFPVVGLAVSGGHTSLYRIAEPGRNVLLAQTLDDAAGEAFDKVAKLCGLPYPGGPAIDRLARTGNPQAVKFPRALPGSLDFSFSGLKTSVALWVRDRGVPQGQALADLLASFQEAVVDVLIKKLFEAAGQTGAKSVAVCGGVAVNSRLRQRLEAESGISGTKLFLAAPELCTDNAVMIALAGHHRLARGEADDLSLNAVATIPIPTT